MGPGGKICIVPHGMSNVEWLNDYNLLVNFKL